MKNYLLLFYFLTCFQGIILGQEKQDSVAKTRPVERLFDFGDKVVDLISGENWTIIPAVVYSPETSLGLGARAIRVFRHKGADSEQLRPSSLPITLLHTLNNQTIFTSELDLWANENKTYFNSRLELANFPFKFFGIGNSPELETIESYTTRFLYVHLNYEKKIAPGLYIGPRYEFRVDEIYRKEDGGLLASGIIPGSNGQRISGLGWVLNFDTRDNIFQPGSGWFNRLQWMTFTPWLGSNFNFDQYAIDLRKYFRTAPKHTMAVQSWWGFTTGLAPFQHLSLIGGSDRMRGYFEGRYRDNHAMVQQVEYRMPVYRNLGIVLFAHGGQVANKVTEYSLNRMRYGGGMGFRYRISPEGLNIRLDFAFGDQKAFYFGLNEVI
jgi:outer membrane protein assembly factor BamA